MTCADATGEAWAIAASGRLPFTARGSRVAWARPTTAAPMRPSGSVTRAIGRCRSDASPVSSVQKGWPASTPSSRRAVVPELPAAMQKVTPELIAPFTAIR